MHMEEVCRGKKGPPGLMKCRKKESQQREGQKDEAEAGGGAISAVWGQRSEVLRMRP